MAPYKRPVIEKPKEPHNLFTAYQHYRQLSLDKDDGWLTKELEVLHEDGQFALGQFLATVSAVKDTDLSIYRDDVQKERKAKPILAARRALMTFLAKHVSKADSNFKAVQNKILRVTEPPTINDEIRALRQDLKFKEIRDFIKAIDPKKRHEVIANNLEYIQACINSPTPFIDPTALEGLRRDYAFKEDPSLVAEEKDAQLIYKSIRKRSGEINGTAIQMLIYANLDDPLPIIEHFEIFPPQTEHEKVLAGGHLLRFQREQDRLEKLKVFQDKNKGVNLEITDRLKRKVVHV